MNILFADHTDFIKKVKVYIVKDIILFLKDNWYKNVSPGPAGSLWIRIHKKSQILYPNWFLNILNEKWNEKKFSLNFKHIFFVN